jgi:hypothetical protein
MIIFLCSGGKVNIMRRLVGAQEQLWQTVSKCSPTYRYGTYFVEVLAGYGSTIDTIPVFF